MQIGCRNKRKTENSEKKLVKQFAWNRKSITFALANQERVAKYRRFEVRKSFHYIVQQSSDKN